MNHLNSACSIKPNFIAHKSIKLREQNLKEAKQISGEFKLSEPTSKILAARKHICGNGLKQYLHPSLKTGLPEPEKLRGLLEACQLIKDVIDADKPIAITCDFDVDGLSGGAQLYHALCTLGAKVFVFVPDRFVDGYGLNTSVVDQAKSKGVKLLIAIDFGTTNTKELLYARQVGLQTIVVDHHFVQAAPFCDVFINPQQDCCGFADGVLSASGLCWYLLAGLRKVFGDNRIDPKSYLDLACLGTICDMVPLIGANRVIAKRGLEALGSSTRPGLCALKEVSRCGKTPTCYDVSFGIGPRINAAGRMVNAQRVIQLLTTNENEVAYKIASELNEFNIERQATEMEIKERAIEIVLSMETLPSGIVVYEKDFHTGVIGIVAQRLTETFFRPTAVLGLDEDVVCKGSVRGIKGVSVIEALSNIREHLIKYGGHEGAGGFSLYESEILNFSRAFSDECSRQLGHIPPVPIVEADTVLNLKDITFELIKELELFSPCGIGNPGPVLLLQNVEVVDVRVVKSTHLRVTLSDGSLYVPAFLWRQSSHPAIMNGAKINVACRPSTNNYNGINEIQLAIQAAEKI